MEEKRTQFQMNLFGENNDLLVNGQMVGKITLFLGIALCICHLLFNTYMMFTRENDIFRTIYSNRLKYVDDDNMQDTYNVTDFNWLVSYKIHPKGFRDPKILEEFDIFADNNKSIIDYSKLRNYIHFRT